MRLRDGKQLSETTLENEMKESSSKDGKQAETPEEKANLEGDYNNVALLLLLYILQGIPLGLSLIHI